MPGQRATTGFYQWLSPDLRLDVWPNRGAGALLFYPGSLLCPTHYRTLLKACANAGFCVASPHLPGHGVNIRHDNFTFQDLLNAGLASEKWLHAHGYGPVAVCGHSQGGILALAHAGQSRTLTAAFSICAVFPQSAEAIEVTCLAPLSQHRKQLLAVISWLGRHIGFLPVPFPFYVSQLRLLKGRPRPLHQGHGKARISYPIKFLASLFNVVISSRLWCPYWLFAAKNDALFTREITRKTFSRIAAPAKTLVWLNSGGHLAPLSPKLCEFMARTMAAACSGLDFPLVLSAD